MYYTLKSKHLKLEPQGVLLLLIMLVFNHRSILALATLPLRQQIESNLLVAGFNERMASLLVVVLTVGSGIVSSAVIALVLQRLALSLQPTHYYSWGLSWFWLAWSFVPQSIFVVFAQVVGHVDWALEPAARINFALISVVMYMVCIVQHQVFLDYKRYVIYAGTLLLGVSVQTWLLLTN